jgi:hypothetical protein
MDRSETGGFPPVHARKSAGNFQEHPPDLGQAKRLGEHGGPRIAERTPSLE